MGIINCRYKLILLESGELRLVTYSPIPRLQKDVPLEWKPDVWYRMKLRFDIENGRGVARGKAWPRGEAEPKDWQIEMADPCPNTEGSPGLYAYSKGARATKGKVGAPIFYDNYKVYRND